MMLRITNLRTRVESPETDLASRAAAAVGINEDQFRSLRILRKSLDARQRESLQFVYSLVVDVPDDVKTRRSLDVRVEPYQPKPFFDPDPGKEELPQRPVIVGSGPAGLLAGYYLALKGYRPIILERGLAVKERVPAIRKFDRGGELDQENNYLFGEGGAGCFSDGKLTCRITGPDVDWVLQSFVDCGGRPSLMYEHRPHLGSNKLPMICRNFRRKIEALGGEYRFGCRFDGLTFSEGRLTGLSTSTGSIPTSHVLLAMGHSARDTYHMLLEAGCPLQAKAFQLGLRIEQPQALINEHKYGRPEYLEQLGAADYTLVAKGERDLFTFCMCAGGIVIPSVSEPNMYCSNGMSNSRHDTPFANSGLVVTLDPDQFGSDHPLAGVEVQRKYEAIAFQLAGADYQAPVQRAHDFLANRTPSSKDVVPSSYQRGAVPRNLNEVLPPVIAKAIHAGLPLMNEKWKGKYLPDAVLVGPEMRGSSPVRIDRDRESFQIPAMPGVYPVGEGAGYAGGIVTAAVDGLRAARKIVEHFAPCKG
ncbi:FAD dependent oxidoreductase [Novipirellula galeiformis]|uniref:FAD dependent oxidoreductase n=1 Tax=Novipirellula galeiformis TaxID=2528004 RepID=A0A5C6C0T2_9BACT|nr:FAD-dependent oxidoreductase [Novipirellula galeiformis]TWU17758.1 FAD dependent oxidoreductase [Novipirellula galeiformis]